VRYYVFLSAFRVCFALLRETKSSENEFRAKAQSGSKGAEENQDATSSPDYLAFRRRSMTTSTPR
jgi:hypothetical protein